MKIVILGAGAIGSLFGALLSQTNDVVLIGRTPHVTMIQQKGLKITGKTQRIVRLKAFDNVAQIPWTPDLLLLTVKSFDTEVAVHQVIPYINHHTIVLSLQNGLKNIDLIRQYIDAKQIIAGVTTQGVIFSQPGIIQHTGIGKTVLGEINGTISARIQTIVRLFNQSGIKTQSSDNIIRDLWVKTIINSSINPLTAFFSCKNGYLLKNPLLERLVELICDESTYIANCEGVMVSFPEMIKRTKEVIRDTTSNESSMFQSIKNRKRTEIDSINGILVTIGKKHRVSVCLNEVFFLLIKSLEQQE